MKTDTLSEDNDRIDCILSKSNQNTSGDSSALLGYPFTFFYDNIRRLHLKHWQQDMTARKKSLTNSEVTAKLTFT